MGLAGLLVATPSMGVETAVKAPVKAAVVPEPVVIEGPAQVLDGDTVRIEKLRIRLHGVDAPELSDPRGPISRGALIDLIMGRALACTVKTTDKYKRPVAVCKAGGVDIAGALVRAGWAYSYTYYSTDYDGAEAEARAAKRGFWAVPVVPTVPDAPPTWPIWLSALIAAGAALCGAFGGAALTNRNNITLFRLDREHAAKSTATMISHEITQRVDELKGIGKKDNYYRIAEVVARGHENCHAYRALIPHLGGLKGDLPLDVSDCYFALDVLAGRVSGKTSYRGGQDTHHNIQYVANEGERAVSNLSRVYKIKLDPHGPKPANPE
jgi:endonuclease YncB( thermonuclease family)